MTNTLLSRMLPHQDPSQVAGLSRFFKCGPGQYGEGDKFLGIKVPITREIVKSTWKEVTFEDLEECISSEYHELRLAALLTLIEIFSHSKKKPKVQQDCIDFCLSHTTFINNWDLVDLSCYPLLGVWLLDKDRTLLYDLARNGKTIWEQRIGIVSTMTFVRAGAVYKNTQQVFTASFLMLYDYSNPLGWVDCYSLCGMTFIADTERMKGLAYPKQDWMGDEEYLVYKVGERIDGEIDLSGILERHTEARDGRPVFVYFAEVESSIQE